MPDFNNNLAESSQADQARMRSAQQLSRLSRSMSVTHLSRLPYGVDRRGEQGLEYPSPMPVVRVIMSLVFLLLVAGAAWLIHWPVIVALFVIFPIVGLVAVHFTAQRYARELFARVDENDLGTSPQTGQPAEQPDRFASERAYWTGDAPAGETEPAADREDVSSVLGPHLASADDPHTSMLLKSLKRPAYEVALHNLAAEREASLAWLAGTQGFEDVTTTSDDGVRLAGHALPAHDPKRWVVLVPSYKSDWTQGMFVARRYAERGYSLLLVDPRGQCGSQGDWIGMGWLDRRDMVAWSQWIVATHGADVTIALHGVGAGAAACCIASAEDDLPAQVRAIVSEDCYTDAWNGVIAAAHGLSLDAHPLLDLGRVYMRAHGGYDLKDADVEARVTRAKAPILFANASGDTLVPPYMSARMSQLARKEQPELGHASASFARAAHGISSLGIPEEYFGKLFAFLEPKMA